jgi:nitrite reductase/ring-hydroxylating ferredoxin subunit
MAYIGRLLGPPNVFVVTGDSGNGLTHGTVAGLLLPALIDHRSHPWRNIYAPYRSRFRGIAVFAKEAVKSNGPYIDWMRGGDVSSLDDIRPGHGATIRRGLHVLAAYKDEHGQCHLMNARCPHASGVVRWNEVEKTWDCPVHGSRFNCDGRVLNGPSSVDLEAAPDNIEADEAIPEPVLGDDGYQLKPV